MQHTTGPARQPKSASLAVTLLCNSRCIHCDIWKNRGEQFLSPEVYRKLPPSLKRIDITGGEPFLRPDLPRLVNVLKETAPHARLLITTNGFLVDKIKKTIGAILAEDPDIVFRLSMDGTGAMHEKVRGIPDAFGKVTATIGNLKAAGVKNIGVIYTLMQINRDHLARVYSLSQQLGINFSLNILHSSPIFYGEGKRSLGPDMAKLKPRFDELFLKQVASLDPRNWAKAWFNRYSYAYATHHQRAFPCGAGEDFFYVDPFANVFACHIKNWPMGNLQRSAFSEIWKSKARMRAVHLAAACHDCWIMCTARDALETHKLRVLSDLPGYVLDASRTRGT